MTVVYAARHRASPAVEEALGGAEHLDLDELLSRSHVVSIHCPLTADTHHLIDARRLAQMRTDAFIVNTARGSIVDERALVDAIHGGRIAGAALDVFEDEPALAPGLSQLEQVVLSPHLGSATVETRTAMAELAAENVSAVLRGNHPRTPVNGLLDDLSQLPSMSGTSPS
jgi:glyoxylate reductase